VLYVLLTVSNHFSSLFLPFFFPRTAYAWNKLWGKQRCGVFNGIHEDSDRFVFRRCSDSTCPKWDNTNPSIEIAAYAYNDGEKPYDGKNPELLKPFNHVIYPGKAVILTIADDDKGNVYFTLSDDKDTPIETQIITHSKVCSNFASGALDGLYTGGPCVAPVTMTVTYLPV
jgi:hypothetical protein